MNFDPNDYNELTVTESPIPGLFVIKLPVHGDNRGWFKENYPKEKMETLGLPSFDIVQNNISFNDKAGATRGQRPRLRRVVRFAQGRQLRHCFHPRN